jgi:hypothetical protein
MAESCAATLQRLGADFGPTTIVDTLSIAQRQLVEIARAVPPALLRHMASKTPPPIWFGSSPGLTPAGCFHFE